MMAYVNVKTTTGRLILRTNYCHQTDVNFKAKML